MKNSSTWQLAAATILVLAVSYAPGLSYSTLTIADALRTLLAGLLIASVLTVTLAFSRWRGWKAVGATFLLYWGVSHFNTLNEAVFFGLDLGPDSAAGLALFTFVAALATAVGTTYVMGRWNEGMEPAGRIETAPRSASGWTWRLLLAAFTYFIFYFIAGMIIFPFVQEFYAGKGLPGLGEIFIMQMMRGLVYAGIGTMIMRMVVLTRNAAALLIGAALSILGGIAPLLPPNEIMPEHIRMVHMAEVGVSNFLFGIVMVRILGEKKEKPKAE